jgi:hypothetical protein
MVTFQVSWEFLFKKRKKKSMCISFSDFIFNKLPPNTIRKVSEVLCLGRIKLSLVMGNLINTKTT